ncbi:hypothetical protein P7D58_22165, partial [Enterococcus avium]
LPEHYQPVFTTFKKYQTEIKRALRVPDCRQKLFQTRNSSLEQLLSTSFRIFEQKNKGSLPFHSQVANF